MIKYSAKKHSCYDTSLPYKDLPEDLIEITKEEHDVFMGEGLPEGKQLAMGVYPFEFEDLPETDPSVTLRTERIESMLTGEDYKGYMVSFTSDDGNGLVQVKTAFELGLTETNIHFSNGTVMPMTSEDFPEFALWFVEKRNSFF
jgi:hypothetical protein